MTETSDHYLALSRVAAGEPIAHYVGTGWTAAEDVEDPEDWWRRLDVFTRSLDEPLRVEMVDSSASR